MATKPKIKGIIFDLDGTLIDTIADIATAMNQALAELGYPEH
ncbi:MAG TPA: HAD hydrolase-like protein, partial [Candidatus Cloacimonadota bacterium]|nr:HAD hydrolase-like protein [Candidatus Cloacimonadota bacterium]